MLKLSTVNLDASAHISEQGLRHDFHDAGLAGARWSQKQQISYGPPRRVESSEESLVDPNDVFDSLILTDNFAVQGIRKFSRVFAVTCRVQSGG